MKNSAKKSSSVKKVLKKIKPYSFYLILALVSAIISVSLTLYIPVLTGNAIDNIIDKGNVDFASVIRILVYIGVGIGGVALFQWIMTYFTNIVSYRTVRDLRREVFEKFNTVPLSYIDTTPHGDLISRVINDVDAVGDGLTQMFLQLFSGIVTIVGTLVFMLTMCGSYDSMNMIVPSFTLIRKTKSRHKMNEANRTLSSTSMASSANGIPIALIQS